MKVIITIDGQAFPLPEGSEEKDWTAQCHVVVEAEVVPTTALEIKALFDKGNKNV